MRSTRKSLEKKQHAIGASGAVFNSFLLFARSHVIGTAPSSPQTDYTYVSTLMLYLL